MKLTEAKLKALILETMEEARFSRKDYSKKIDEVGRIITRVLDAFGERLEGSDEIQMGQTSNEQTNMVEFTIMKDVAEGMGFIKGRLLTPSSQVGAGRTSKPTSEALEIAVSNMSPTRDPNFKYVSGQTTFKFDDIINDRGEALFAKIVDYDYMLGSEDSGSAMSESYYDSENRASDPGEHDKILGMIQTMDLEMWNQAFSFLEMGMALDWDEDAKLDLVWDIYEGISRYKMEYIRPIQRLINRYDDQDPFMPKAADIPTKKEVEDPGGYRDRVEILSKNWEDLKLAVADLLGIKPGTPLPQENQWKQAFKNKGII
tara:strand:+ start:50 stop:997 length:948 start_codon:yes stop_codon:yes gene_type:complete